jgi:hypothetical protein
MSWFAFQWPIALLLLLLIPLMAWLLTYARQKRSALIAVMGGGMSTHRKLRDILRLSALLFVILALARPGYAPVKEAISSTGRDVVFALDVSQSMLAEDVYPSRLEVAKQGIRDALQAFGNERVGLMVYAGSSSILCPLTNDYDFVRYMLEQAHPRTVDFGGTTLQSAVEKAVDQIFLEGRENVQDLIVLTDGGDHGSRMNRVIELLEEKAVDVMLVGIGDPNNGSPIPVMDDEGNRTFLEYQGSPVYTQLDGEALAELSSRSSRVEYNSVEISPFDLGRLYIDYAQGRQIESTDSDAGIVVYKEAAFFLFIPAIILLLLAECWGAKGLQLGHATALLMALILTAESEAVQSPMANRFDQAVEAYRQGDHEGALLQFTEIHQSTTGESAQNGDLSAVQINRGLALLQLANMSAETAPQAALDSARMAQQAFLSAKRYAPESIRAGRRIESTAEWISQLEQEVASQEQQPSDDQSTPDQSDDSDSDEDYEEDYDYMEDAEEGEMSSEAFQGDLVAGAQMQELPVPNYSAEEILMEEQGNLQFRQQKRASANAGKVEKDF